MAKKKKQSKRVAPQPATKTQPQNGAGSMAKGPRRLVLALVLGGLVLIFVTSFIYRMDHTLHRKMVPAQEHDHGDTAAQGQMPPGMPPTDEGGGMGAMMGQDGEGMDEIRTLMQRMRDNPNDPEVLVALSKRFMSMQDMASAGNFLQRALVADPANVEAMGLLGMVRFETGQHEEAAELLRRLVKLDSDNATHFYNLGMVEKHFLDQPESAKEHLETALSLVDEHSDMGHRIQNELGIPHDHSQSAPEAAGEQPPEPPSNATGS
ncbi:MAG: tetratricopeptide repeat protein [Oceanidesulfovibrio sp.]